MNLPNLNNKSSSTRNLIISVLAENWPLSAKKIHETLKRKHARDCSYQAVHKLLKELQDEGIVHFKDKKYLLNLDWVKSIETFSKKVTDAYLTDKKSVLERLDNGESVNMSFDTVTELGSFLIFDWFNFPSKDDRAFMHWYRTYSLVGLSKHQMDGMRKITSHLKLYTLVKKNSLVDRFLGIALQKVGYKVKFGVDVASECDLFIFGDYILRVYWPEALMSTWDKLWHKTKKVDEFDLDSMLRSMHDRDQKINVTINKNPAVAQQLKEKTLAYFK
jgi:hypothetical protein